MIPVNIQDIIAKAINKKTNIHHRQFDYDTLVKIHKATGIAIAMFEEEMNEKRR